MHTITLTSFDVFSDIYIDTEGREVKYLLKPSLKKQRSTFLQVLIADLRPRKVRKITYNDVTNTIDDSKESFSVPSKDIAAVLKSLNLLCKIASIQLECTSGEVALRKVLTSLDGNATLPLKKVSSCNSLAERRHSTPRLGSISERGSQSRARSPTGGGSNELSKSFTLYEDRQASATSLMRGLTL